LELRHLRYFLAAADALHFTKAARALHISQPTLSLQIKELERELGAPLFDRVGRSVRLTEAGALFRRHAARALQETELGREAVGDLLGLRRGRLRVGVTHSFSAALIPRAIARFRRQYPGIDVLIEKTSGRAIEQGLVAGALDLGIAFAPPESVEVESETLFEAEIVLIAAPNHPLASRHQIKLADLDGLPLVLPTREFATRRLVDERMQEVGARTHLIVEMNDIDSLLEIVRLGTGATVLSRRAVADGRGLSIVAITRPKMTRTAALLWLRDSHRPAAAREFMKIVREIGSKLP
jgi:LysR family transcriptional regulator, cyn operon transcriptional activator